LKEIFFKKKLDINKDFEHYVLKIWTYFDWSIIFL